MMRFSSIKPVCLSLAMLLASNAQAQQVLADAPSGDPALAGAVLEQLIPAVPNDIIFGLLAGGFDDRPAAPANDAEAARFLTQATFGPTMTEINELKSIGYAAWIDRQLSLDATLQRPELERQVAQDVAVNPRGAGVYAGFRQERWFATAAKSSDQLRQRMAFALSQVLVMSDVGALDNQPIAVSEYNDILLRNAFGSYRTLLTDVTYSPMMGRYLTTFRNTKTDWTIPSGVANGPLLPGLVAPDENYAREIMQLFSIGLVERNRNFTPIPQAPPTYTQDIISQTAKAFTGLSFSCSPDAVFGVITLTHPCGGCVGTACNFSATAYFSTPRRYTVLVPGNPQPILTGLYHPDTYRPMACYPRYADTGRSQEPLNSYAVLPAPFDKKVIIAGVTINASPVRCYTNTPAADRAACINYCTSQIDTVVNTLSLHPNVAPFLSRQLIQRFTTSNPSSDYIDRVAAVFENDGSNARGNLGAVVKAILLDPEARSATPALEFGKLREPLLRLTAIWRAFEVSPTSTGTYGVVFPERIFAQRPLGAQSVFNFYEPDFQQAGEIANAGLFSPEFQILDESTAIAAADELYIRIFNGYSTAAAASTPFTEPVAGRAGFASYLPPAAIDALPTNNAELLEALNVRMLAGQMSAAMKTKVLALMNGAMAATDHRRRALSMIHLIAISPEFAIQR